MTKKGNSLTEEVWEKVEINKQQYEDILFYGCIKDFDTLLVKFFRIVAPRTNEVELLKFEHIYYDVNECDLFAKWIRPKCPSKATEEEKELHQLELQTLIKLKLKKNELIEIKYRGSKTFKGKPNYKQKQIGEFNDEVKKLLLDHEYNLKAKKTDYVFRTNSTKKYALTGKSMLERFHNIIKRTNERLITEGKLDRVIKHPGGTSEQFRLHDLGRHSFAKKLKNNLNMAIPMAKKLRHTPETLIKRYARPSVRDFKEIYRDLEKQ
ncbi:MAG: hypothetical protein PF569_08015 [Candidatus Woesearchaeota archaeon]|jgi:hypothetical protein|nr:hypothetical protein [Candidatus Woesearchaeota archaeon]